MIKCLTIHWHSSSGWLFFWVELGLLKKYSSVNFSLKKIITWTLLHVASRNWMGPENRVWFPFQSLLQEVYQDHLFRRHPLLMWFLLLWHSLWLWSFDFYWYHFLKIIKINKWLSRGLFVFYGISNEVCILNRAH